MKYSELDENHIFAAIGLFKKFIRDSSSFGDTPGAGRMVALHSQYAFPNLDSLKKQIEFNIQNIDNPRWYLGQLKREFSFLHKTDLLVQLKRYKDIIDKRVKTEIPVPLEEIEKWLLEINEFGKRDYNDPTERDVENLLRSQKNIKYFFSLAETIQETIKDAEQEFKQQPPTAEAVEEEVQAEKPKNKLNFEATKGNKITLYHVLRQLYDREIIKNTWPEIAEFLIENVTGFENSNSKNLAGELSRRTDPLISRIIQLPNLTELD